MPHRAISIMSPTRFSVLTSAILSTLYVKDMKNAHHSNNNTQTSFEVTSTMPMVSVIELFRRLGMRFVLVMQSSRLVGIITRKDVLRHISAMDSKHRDDSADVYDYHDTRN